MSISKNENFPPSQSIEPRYQRIIQDPGTGLIIIDDVMTPGIAETHTEVNRSTAWLKVEPGFHVTVLSGAPSGLSALDTIAPWSRLEVLVQSNELYVIEHSALPMSAANQQKVTGFAFGAPGDSIVIKIDQSSNSITLYESNGRSV
ncbi:MAG: hypothetical protein IT259_10590 [Saprospiraceae bacterium]|nr:hypothetical protein [Saprospiraceae bacterium]